MPTAAVLTVSDRASAGAMQDESGPAAARLLESAGFDVRAVDVVPDEADRISDWLLSGADAYQLLVTTGGTGLTPRDVTPQATARVLDYEVPGLAEAMRSKGLEKTAMAMLSRSRAGVRGRALILNLPGSVKGVTESLEAVLAVLPHAVAQLGGRTGHSGEGGTQVSPSNPPS
ncbi:MAG: MogA/MoaB family molybdenum cofactor biosynthesis protein [Candidatus Dormibacteraeota bacterium]|nr:MogA/MoaB family molybdenum cofactor biosynthesis protein [Candidatus Dormibacteraeota bacterium]